MRLKPRTSKATPLISGCSGRSILAFLPEEEAEDIIRGHAPKAVRRGLPALLARIRAQSYALSFSDKRVEMNGVAAPLGYPNDGTALGSIAIAGLVRRLPKETLLHLVTPLHAACSQLAPRLSTFLGPNSLVRLETISTSQSRTSSITMSLCA